MNNLVQLTLQQCNPQSNSGDFTFCFNYCHNKPKIVLKSVQQKHYLTYDKQEAKRFKTDSNLTINIGTTTTSTTTTTTTNTNNIAKRRFIKNKQVNRRRNNNNNNNNKLNSTSNIKVIMCYIFCFIIIKNDLDSETFYYPIYSILIQLTVFDKF